MFTGEAPATHLTTQIPDRLDPYFPTAAQFLHLAGYQNTGFSNNPQVGADNNGLERGFDKFYNYGGVIPSSPPSAVSHPIWFFTQVRERSIRLLHRVADPIQTAVAHSNSLLSLWLNPLFIPLWERSGFLKGDTQKSISDAAQFIHAQLSPGQYRPHFVFINLMETHLPLHPPPSYIARFAPTIRDERLARDFMRLFNTQVLRWILPMEEPFSELESQSLNEMYNAEVASQDHMLAALLE